MSATGGTVGPAEWIIDDIHVLYYELTLSSMDVLKTLDHIVKKMFNKLDTIDFRIYFTVISVM